MLISVSELLKNEDSEKPLKADIDVSDLDFSPASISFVSPVSVDGRLKNLGGVIELSAKCSGTYKTLCDRCGTEIEEKIQYEVREEFVKSEAELENDSEAVVLVGQQFELKDTVSQFLYCALPTKHLCDINCKGLCQKCGKNLNEGECSCEDDEWNPQFEALRGLFD